MSATVVKRDRTPNRRARRAGGKATKGRFFTRKGVLMRETPERLDASIDEANLEKALKEAK